MNCLQNNFSSSVFLQPTVAYFDFFFILISLFLNVYHDVFGVLNLKEQQLLQVLKSLHHMEEDVHQ